MPAKSEKQQNFFGMVHAMQKGKKVKNASPRLKKVAKEMKPEKVKEFAKTKTKGLPKEKGLPVHSRKSKKAAHFGDTFRM